MWGWEAAEGSFLVMGLPLQAEYGGTSRAGPPSPTPGKAHIFLFAGGKKEVEGLTAWLTWREWEEKSTEQVPISPLPDSSRFLRVHCILDTMIESHFILTTAL